MALTVAALAFAAAAALAATLGGLAVGSITAGVAATSLALGLVLAVLSARATRGVAHAGRDSGATTRVAVAAAWVALLLAGFRQFLWLGLSDGTSVTQLNPYNYGDLPSHRPPKGTLPPGEFELNWFRMNKRN